MPARLPLCRSLTIHAASGLCLAFILGASAALSSCSAKAKAQTADVKPIRAALALDYPGRGDASSNDLAWRGLVEAARELKASVSDGEQLLSYGRESSFTAASPRAEGRDRQQLLLTLAEEGNDIVILMGEAYADALKNVAPGFPGTRFVLMDARPREGYGNNCSFVSYDSGQIAYLSGALAGALSLNNPKAKLGFLSGPLQKDSDSLEAGWQRAALRVNSNLEDPKNHVSLKLEAETPKKKGLSIAQALSQFSKAGAKLVFWAEAKPSVDILDALKGSDILFINYPADARSEYRFAGMKTETYSALLASAFMRHDVAIPYVLKAFAAERKLPANILLGLEEGCLSLIFNPAHESLIAPHAGLLKTISAELVDGRGGIGSGVGEEND